MPIIGDYNRGESVINQKPISGSEMNLIVINNRLRFRDGLHMVNLQVRFESLVEGFKHDRSKNTFLKILDK